MYYLHPWICFDCADTNKRSFITFLMVFTDIFIFLDFHVLPSTAKIYLADTIAVKVVQKLHAFLRKTSIRSIAVIITHITVLALLICGLFRLSRILCSWKSKANKVDRTIDEIFNDVSEKSGIVFLSVFFLFNN